MEYIYLLPQNGRVILMRVGGNGFFVASLLNKSWIYIENEIAGKRAHHARSADLI